MSKTFEFLQQQSSLPIATTWLLSALAEARGRQELFTKQSPQKLKVLKEHAIVESTISSNRIEGVLVEPSRVVPLISGQGTFRDRDEEEVQGYRDALKWIHAGAGQLELDETTIWKFHQLTRGQLWDAGAYKEKNIDIIEKYPDGRQRIRFKSVPAKGTPAAMKKLVATWKTSRREHWSPDALLLAAFNLDFLCVHPFRDGNGRVSRLILLLSSYQAGLEVGRYISLERLIEETKDRYYETLESSSKGWHEGKHDPWPYLNYILTTLKHAYQEFEERVGQVKEPKGAKTEAVRYAARTFGRPFRLSEIEEKCPSVSREMIRKVLADLKKEGVLISSGKGVGARWQNKGNTS
ncbi:MAG: Fic family protein [Blastochloris sp.]|nr:Fic family protein [Blastochloris sp.]